MAGMPDAARGTIFSTAQLGPIDSVDFRGACHGTQGVATVKSQPYRLESTKCGGKGDGRLTCIACHDPHQQTEGGTVIVRCGMPERSRSIHRRQAYNQSPRGGVFR